MFGIRLPARRPTKDEAEKPFWISFSDLMTALMVLFLIAMSVALLAITQKVRKQASIEEERKGEIEQCLGEIKTMTKSFPGIEIKGYSIDFGTHARFKTDSHALDEASKATLRGFVPKVLDVARHKACDKWFKRVIVEGFASQSGTYIYNLNLSLQRAERVLCVLLDNKGTANALGEEDRKAVRELFLVGGSSFNALKESPSESQRIELKLEFLVPGEKRTVPREAPLDQAFSCPIDRP